MESHAAFICKFVSVLLPCSVSPWFFAFETGCDILPVLHSPNKLGENL